MFIGLIYVVDISEIIISFSGNVTETAGDDFTGTAGDNITLTCLANITITNVAQTNDVTFEWFFNNSIWSSLPPGVTVLDVSRKDSVYSSTLQFSPLTLPHAGMYMCRLWKSSTQMASAKITVNCKCQILTIQTCMRMTF